MFASNTSSLSVTEMSNGLSRPVIGMHFFNPAPVMQLVEVIRGELSTDEQVAKIIEIAKDIGKDPVEVNESAGYANWTIPACRLCRSRYMPCTHGNLAA